MAEEFLIVYNREPLRPVELLDQRNSQQNRKRPAPEVYEPAIKSQRLEAPQSQSQKPHKNGHQPPSSRWNNSRDGETDKSSTSRQKFKNERSATTGKLAASHKVFATPSSIQSAADPVLPRLSPQQHPPKPQTDGTTSFQQFLFLSPAFIQSLLKTVPNVAEPARKKAATSSAMRPKSVGRSSACDHQPSSSKGIKSTVPKKISAVKADEKVDSLYERQLKWILEDIPETYTPVKKGKQRIAHGSSKAHSKPETSVNGSGRAGSNQGYWSMSESEPSLGMLESGCQSNTEAIQQKSEERKRKGQSKELEHQRKRRKLNNEPFPAPSGSTSGSNADAQPSLKICFKKNSADGEYFIKPMLA